MCRFCVKSNKTQKCDVMSEALLVLTRHRKCSPEIVEICVAGGANINTRDNITGNTPLHHAVEAGHLEVVRELLELGANCHLKDKRGRSPLILAAYNNHIHSILFEKW